MVEEKIDYEGNDIKQGAKTFKVVENQEACAKLSAENEKAKFWTYQPSSKKCWIKTSNAGKRPLKTVNSGNQECGAGCVVEEKTDYEGNDIKQGAKTFKVVENQEACAKLSAENEKAKFWTYQPSTKKCWIKTSNAGKTPLKTVNSGNQECGA